MGKRLLVVGGDTAGMSATVQARRLMPDLEIVVVERGRWTSYSACGIPYLASGAVRTPEDLVVRTPEDFRTIRVDVRTGHEVTGIDLAARRAEVHNLTHGRSFVLGFDLLLLATGARPVRPGVAGSDLEHVHGVRTLDDAARLLDDAKERRPEKVAVVGSSHSGLELAESFHSRGAAVRVLEPGPEILPGFGADVAARVARAMRNAGITVETGVTVDAIHDTTMDTSAGDVPADLVILAAGVEPNSELGAAAGVRTGTAGAIEVDRRQRTSAEGVWAAGDCCTAVHRVSGASVHQPLGPVAAKQGRVAGVNVGGGYAAFPGVLGTAAARVCGVEFGRTGLSAAEAEASGFSALGTTVESAGAESYLSESRPTMVELVAERGTGRLLGVQSVGGPGSAKRVDVVAAALVGGLTLDDLIGLDLAYAPPVSTVWDPLQAAARALASQL